MKKMVVVEGTVKWDGRSLTIDGESVVGLLDEFEGRKVRLVVRAIE